MSVSVSPQEAENIFQQGLGLQQQGRLAEAAALYEQVLAVQADHFNALHLLGLIAVKAKNPARAANLMGKAIALRPEVAAVHFNLGIALLQLQRSEDALLCFEQVIALNPDHAKAYFHRGRALEALRRFEDAITSYDLAIDRHPAYAAAYVNRGTAFQGLQRTQEALASFEHAVALSPTDAEAHFNCGNALAELERFSDAVASYERAISIEPTHTFAHNNLGNALCKLNRIEAALSSFDRALAIEPGNAAVHYNRGKALSIGKFSREAVASFSTAVALEPNYASAHWNMALEELLLGHFQTGWELYEWRWKLTDRSNVDLINLPQPMWIGDADLAGQTILLRAEQGLGDTIQFCRYAKLVKAFGATVLLEVPKALTALLASLEGVDLVIEQGSALPAFDYHCPLMSLPLAFKTRLETIPSSTKYLHAHPAKVTQWQQRLGPAQRPLVGLVWSGGFRPDQPELWALNGRRNLPLDQLKALAGLNVDFISLQKGEPAESEFVAALQAGWDGPAIANYADQLQDFSDTAALIENLDLVISVDTSVAHLAAALGKPVWILNRFDSCWRWLQDRTDSPWYPTVTLYNQRTAGDWAEVLQRVQRDMQRWPN